MAMGCIRAVSAYSCWHADTWDRLYPDPDTLVRAVCGSGYLGKSCIRLQYADTGCIHASHGRELSIRDESDRSYLIKREMSIRDESDRTY